MISKSTSRMAAPLFFVPKKDGGQRMCIDYRKLNEITIRDTYPLPNMESLLEAARGAKVFSKFDLRSAYNMFRVRPGDEWKTAFVTPWGLYEFNVMHYGFVNAPACLQRYMDHILAPLIYKVPAQVTVYMELSEGISLMQSTSIHKSLPYWKGCNYIVKLRSVLSIRSRSIY